MRPRPSGESADILARGRRAADERVERLASVAQLDARKLELSAKQEMLARAYDRALEKLTGLPDGAYTDLLAQLAVEASSTGREAVILSPRTGPLRQGGGHPGQREAGRRAPDPVGADPPHPGGTDPQRRGRGGQLQL